MWPISRRIGTSVFWMIPGRLADRWLSSRYNIESSLDGVIDADHRIIIWRWRCRSCEVFDFLQWQRRCLWNDPRTAPVAQTPNWTRNLTYAGTIPKVVWRSYDRPQEIGQPGGLRFREPNPVGRVARKAAGEAVCRKPRRRRCWWSSDVGETRSTANVTYIT